jgi:hypothetical protein
MATPRWLLHLAMAKVSTVAQSLVERQGHDADVTLGEWPFRLALGNDRLRDLSLPHLNRPGLELLRRATPTRSVPLRVSVV